MLNIVVRGNSEPIPKFLGVKWPVQGVKWPVQGVYEAQKRKNANPGV